MQNEHGIKYCHSHQGATMHNSPAIICRECTQTCEHDLRPQNIIIHNLPAMIGRMEWRWRWNHQLDCHHQMSQHNLPAMVGRAGWGHRIVSMIKSSRCHNIQLTSYNFQSKIENGQGIMSMITVTKMPHYTTHQLWLGEQDEEWTWNHENDCSHQDAIIHNSHPRVSKAGWRIYMESWAWS